MPWPPETLVCSKGAEAHEGDFSVLPVGLARAVDHGGRYMLCWPGSLSQEGSPLSRCAGSSASGWAAPRFNRPRVSHSRAAAWCWAVLSRERRVFTHTLPPLKCMDSFVKCSEVSAWATWAQRFSGLFLMFVSFAEKWFLFLEFTSSIFAFVKLLKKQIEKEY